MFWFWKKRGITVVVNNTINLRNPSPGFNDLFVREARRQGRDITFWHRRSKADIVLLIGKTKFQDQMERFRKAGAKFVIRIDGIGVKDPSNPHKSYNWQTYQQCDAAIFQSQFCQEVWAKVFKIDRPSYIVLNGADEKVFSRQGQMENFGFRRFMVTAARWREWKNFKQVLEVFLALNEPDLGLVVIGEGIEIHKHPRIIYTGRLRHKQMAKIFRGADLFIYLPWFEWCPKVVSQALLTGLPVLCSYNGGTKELVQDCGIAVPGERDPELEYFYPNPVNLEQAVKSARILLEKNQRVRPRPDLYLAKMVEDYYKVFEQVLENG